MKTKRCAFLPYGGNSPLPFSPMTAYGDICHTHTLIIRPKTGCLYILPTCLELFGQQFHTCICKTNHRNSCLKLLEAGGSQSNIIKNVKSQLDLGRRSWALSWKDDVCALPWLLHYRERGPVCEANSRVTFPGEKDLSEQLHSGSSLLSDGEANQKESAWSRPSSSHCAHAGTKCCNVYSKRKKLL